MSRPTRVWFSGTEKTTLSLKDTVEHLSRERGSATPWELEIGFGKGRYLLRRAQEDPDRLFLGIEIASQYYRLTRDRAVRKDLKNLVLVHGEALFLLDAMLPRDWVDVAHIYFPDPWPKIRHHKRRLFDPETIDVLLRSMSKPNGVLHFASDHVPYSTKVHRILREHPALRVAEHAGIWPDGARTNYEAKYEIEGRQILRLSVAVDPEAESLIHPEGVRGLLSALAPPRASDEDELEATAV